MKTLFDVSPEWGMLANNKCPLCGNKLYFPKDRGIGMCKGRKHADRKPFIIRDSKLKDIINK